MRNRVPFFFFSECFLDICLVVDESGSIEEDDPQNWDRIKAFLNNMVDVLDISKVRLGAVTFGNDAVVRFFLNNGYTTKSQYRNDINGWDYRGGNTNTTGGLRVAREQVFNQNNGDRSNVNDLIIVITDGNATREVDQLPGEVRSLQNRGITRVALGVTSRIDERQLQSMVTAPANDNLFFSDTFTDLLTHVNRILNAGCF